MGSSSRLRAGTSKRAPLAVRALKHPRDVARGLRVVWWTVAARLMLATGGFKLVRRVLRYRVVEEVERPWGAAPQLAPEQGRALSIAVRVLDKVEKKVTCLPRSIVLERACRAQRVPAELVIGVDRSNGFAAHAWVEIDGYALGATEAGRMQWTALGRFSRDAAR